ncbi:sperm microtubule associated protein 2-like [Struthio camelus]|uniref:sperm microtubule associated protein 2-like n=1 Tax=Struthio camelus TaxID=8801 RepID=UPI003603FE9F
MRHSDNRVKEMCGSPIEYSRYSSEAFKAPFEVVDHKAQALPSLWGFRPETLDQQDRTVTSDLDLNIQYKRLQCCIMHAPGTQASFCRLQELARPKKVFCANDPRLMWGNQQTIWTLSRGAMTARPSPRTVALAKPKRNFDGKPQRRPLFLYSCGRESEIWERPPLVDFGLPSDRLLKLSEPKKHQAAYLQQRPRQSPEWPVSPGALSCEASPRVLQLAQPKALHPAFLPAREVETQVTSAAALARPSSRLQHLAEPRLKKETCYYDLGSPECAIWPVSKAAQQAIASPRTLELAKAKRLLPDYKPLRDAEWPVTKAATLAVATPRLVELAQPRKRPPMDLAQFNPEAFTVKEAAKKATCSARLQELAQPVKH